MISALEYQAILGGIGDLSVWVLEEGDLVTVSIIPRVGFLRGIQLRLAGWECRYTAGDLRQLALECESQEQFESLLWDSLSEEHIP